MKAQCNNDRCEFCDDGFCNKNYILINETGNCKSAQISDDYEEVVEKSKYEICCPICDLPKCVRNTDKCEAEIWKKEMLEVGEQNGNK